MISLLETSANTCLDMQCLPVHSLLEDDYFATVPMIAFSPIHAAPSVEEEEIYTSFEEAISERAARISHHLSSQPLAVQQDPADAPPAIFSPGYTGLCHRLRAWRHAITLTGLALSLLLAGFDLMGLLVMMR